MSVGECIEVVPENFGFSQCYIHGEQQQAFYVNRTKRYIMRYGVKNQAQHKGLYNTQIVKEKTNLNKSAFVDIFLVFAEKSVNYVPVDNQDYDVNEQLCTSRQSPYHPQSNIDHSVLYYTPHLQHLLYQSHAQAKPRHSLQWINTLNGIVTTVFALQAARAHWSMTIGSEKKVKEARRGTEDLVVDDIITGVSVALEAFYSDQPTPNRSYAPNRMIQND
eukprot:14517071-Ditylum_brightwellii.AAC.1